MWENYSTNKKRIDETFDYQFREFTNRQAASLAELTQAGFAPAKMNKAIDKIYEEATVKTGQIISGYIGNVNSLNTMSINQAQEKRNQENQKTVQQERFITQYI